MSEQAATDRSTLVTPFNVIAGIIVIIGLVLTAIRFTKGLGATTNLSDYNPWGIWIGFDLLVGVALAAGGYVTSAAVYIFGMKKYHAAVRPAILTGFLGYALVVFALHYDVGQPWRLPYPFLVSQGTTSLLFEVGACVALYLTVLFIEFSPAAMEWLGLKKARSIVVKLTMLLTIFGVILSTLHQSSLGALFLIAPSKLHPLWYSSYIPIYFFVTSTIAGLSMVIFESTLSHHYFHNKMDDAHKKGHNDLALGFGKAAAWVLAGYFIIKVIGVAADDNWHYLATRVRRLVPLRDARFRGPAGLPLCRGGKRQKHQTDPLDGRLDRAGHRCQPVQCLFGGLQLSFAVQRTLLSALDGDRYFGIYRHRGHSGVSLHRDPYAHSLRTPGLRTPLAAGLTMAGNRPAE
jgi:formate-dependent nitrite reductase membrane component NrfD